MTKKVKNRIFASALTALALLSFMLVGCNTKKPDENGMFKIGDMWFSEQGEFSQKAPELFAKKLNDIRNNYLSIENNIYYSIIPDKSFYIKDDAYSVPNYEIALSQVISLLPDMNYIDITKSLSLNDYFLTDPHFKQEALQGVITALGDKMNFEVNLKSFKLHKLDGFIGSYRKNLPENITGEELAYLESDYTKNAEVQFFGTKDFEEITVYSPEKYSTSTPYDIFLSGASPIIKINNKSSKNNAELVIFRDSYASSLAPLLIEEYNVITLIDLRYMASQLLPEYITFTNQDVLFLYSTGIIENSAILR